MVETHTIHNVPTVAEMYQNNFYVEALQQLLEYYLKMAPRAKIEKVKIELQEYFGKGPTQLHASRELTKAQM